MAFDKQQAENNLRNILERIKSATHSIQENILGYRGHDTINTEDDEYKTMKDIRYYLLRNYKEIDSILTVLDRYK